MLNTVSLPAASALVLAVPAAVPAASAVQAIPAVPAVHSTSSSWGEDTREIPEALDWQIRPADTEAAPGAINFELGFRVEHHSQSWGRNLTLGELPGLSSAQLQGEGQPVNFTLRRDAGDFRCRGVAGQGKGVGTCVYAANAAFPPALAKRGINGSLSSYQQFELTMSDTGFAYVDELKRHAFGRPEELIRLRDHGISAGFIRVSNQSGTRLTPDQLIRLRDRGGH